MFPSEPSPRRIDSAATTTPPPGYETSLIWGAGNGVVFVNSDSALRVEGQKTIAYEIAEQSVEQPFDWFLVPTSSGGNFSAIGKGFREVVEWGLLERSPRLVAVQAEGRLASVGRIETLIALVQELLHQHADGHRAQHVHLVAGTD